MQPLTVTCVVTSDTSLPSVSEVILQYRDHSGALQIGFASYQQKGQFLILSYYIEPQAGSWVTCSLSHTTGEQLAARILPEYYSE